MVVPKRCELEVRWREIGEIFTYCCDKKQLFRWQVKLLKKDCILAYSAKCN